MRLKPLANKQEMVT